MTKASAFPKSCTYLALPNVKTPTRAPGTRGTNFLFVSWRPVNCSWKLNCINNILQIVRRWSTTVAYSRRRMLKRYLSTVGDVSAHLSWMQWNSVHCYLRLPCHVIASLAALRLGLVSQITWLFSGFSIRLMVFFLVSAFSSLVSRLFLLLDTFRSRLCHHWITHGATDLVHLGLNTPPFLGALGVWLRVPISTWGRA